jgi:hypothetical protein
MKQSEYQYLLDALKIGKILNQEEQALLAQFVHQNQIFADSIIQTIENAPRISREYTNNFDITGLKFAESLWNTQVRESTKKQLKSYYIELRKNKPEQWKGVHFDDVPLYPLLEIMYSKDYERFFEGKKLGRKGSTALTELKATHELIKLFERIHYV